MRAFPTSVRYNNYVASLWSIRWDGYTFPAYMCRGISRLKARKQVLHMSKQPENMYWLQNNNERQPPRQGPSGRPNGQTPQRPSNNLNRWLLLVVGVLFVVYIVNWFNSTNQSNNAPQQVELTYTQFYDQIAAKNIKTATILGQTDITGTLKQPVHSLTQYHVYQLPKW